jgi:hypothetical protein
MIQSEESCIQLVFNNALELNCGVCMAAFQCISSCVFVWSCYVHSWIVAICQLVMVQFPMSFMHIFGLVIFASELCRSVGFECCVYSDATTRIEYHIQVGCGCLCNSGWCCWHPTIVFSLLNLRWSYLWFFWVFCRWVWGARVSMIAFSTKWYPCVLPFNSSILCSWYFCITDWSLLSHFCFTHFLWHHVWYCVNLVGL